MELRIYGSRTGGVSHRRGGSDRPDSMQWQTPENALASISTRNKSVNTNGVFRCLRWRPQAN